MKEDPVQVRDVMTSPAVSVRPHVPIGRAVALLVTHGFTAVPVVDAAGRLLGLATEADLVRGRIAADGDPVDDRRDESAVHTVMTPRPQVVEDTSDLADAAAVMLRSRARSLPVLHDGKLVGMVTTQDLLRAIAARNLVAPAVRS